MRIVINDIAASTGGALTVLKSFYNFIRENDTVNEYIFFLSDNYLEETNNIKVVIFPQVKKNQVRKMCFDFLTGKSIIEKYNPDYVLSFQNIVTFGVHVRQGTYIHQSIPFQKIKRFSFLKKDEFKFAVYQWIIGAIIKLSAKCADDVFVQTKWMKRAVVEMSPVSSDKVHVIPFGNSVYHIQNRYCFENTKFFYPATDENPYKNQNCVYAAVEKLKKDGFYDFEVTFTLDGQSTKNLNFCGRIDKEKMYANYQSSTLVFPSYIETIGLPLVEAKSVGALILAADCEYAHEILYGYENAYFFDPMNPDELAELMKKTIEGVLRPKPVSLRENEEVETWQVLLKKIEKKIM